MKSMLGLAVIPFVLLAGCASVEKAGNGAKAASAGSYYCWKNKLAAEGDNLVCNWETSAADACRSTHSTSMSKGTVGAGPKDAGRCANGEWLVQVTTK